MKRRADQMRAVSIEPLPTAAAAGVQITQGETRVMCTASLSTEVPPFLVEPQTGRASSGWVTAEYAMLPGATPERQRRGTDSRATEIRRLVARALRAAVDLEKMPGLAITCDCDVLVADGGTRTASITGAYVALVRALNTARERGLLYANPLLGPVAAVSVGLIEGQPVLDLAYEQDSRADVDMNVVMNGAGQYIELQGTGERTTFTPTQLQQMLELAHGGIGQLIEAQQRVLQAIA